MSAMRAILLVYTSPRRSGEFSLRDHEKYGTDEGYPGNRPTRRTLLRRNNSSGQGAWLTVGKLHSSRSRREIVSMYKSIDNHHTLIDSPVYLRTIDLTRPPSIHLAWTVDRQCRRDLLKALVPRRHDRTQQC